MNVERHAFALAETNRARVNKIRLGQTLVEVEKIMGLPERRAARLRYDGVSIEEWSYITDYVRKMDALILFVGGKVQEIQSTSWDKRIRDSLPSADPPARPLTPLLLPLGSQLRFSPPPFGGHTFVLAGVTPSFCAAAYVLLAGVTPSFCAAAYAAAWGHTFFMKRGCPGIEASLPNQPPRVPLHGGVIPPQ
ncbi:MAG TPA: hypothetical protein VEK57_27505 [Thermoanaerobaculia bacterium]|nr:hypothetical protein [Thermoanaerobaculia bacterium]